MNTQNIKSKNSILKVKLLVLLSIFGLNFFLMFSGEILSAIMSYRLFSQGISISERWLTSFRPLVLVLYVVLTTIIGIIVLRLMSPLFEYIEKGTQYDRARTALVKIPKWLILIQNIFWAAGTLIYFIIRGWDAESGHSFGWVINMKLAAGMVSGIFSALIVHYLVRDFKDRLKITDIRKGERDFFLKHKENIAFGVTLYGIITYLGFILITYQQHWIPLGTIDFPIDLVFWITSAFLLFFGLMMFMIMNSISKFQVVHLMNTLAAFTSGGRDFEKRVVLHNFDEIGHLAGEFNKVLELQATGYKAILSSAVHMDKESKAVASAVGSITQAVGLQQQAFEQIHQQSEVLIGSMDEVGEALSRQSQVMINHLSAMDHLKDGNRHILGLTQQMKSLTQNKLESSRASMETAQKAVTQNFEISEAVKIISGLASVAAEKTLHVDEILIQIEDIAAKTNVLAINAAIEAAHSGLSGKGFAVIADQVRKVAHMTSESVKKTSALILDLKDSVVKTTTFSTKAALLAQHNAKQSEEAQAALGEMQQAMEDTARQFFEVASTTGQQDQLVETLYAQTMNLDELRIDIDKAMTPQKKGSEVLERALEDLRLTNGQTKEQSMSLSQIAIRLVAAGKKLGEGY